MTYLSIFTLAGIVFTVFLLVLAAMAVGVMFGRRAISGSCGGLGNKTDGEGNTSCSLCQNPSESCKELKAQMAESASTETPK